MSLTPSVDYRSLFSTRPSLSNNSIELIQRQIAAAEAQTQPNTQDANKKDNAAAASSSTAKSSKKRSRDDSEAASTSSSGPVPPPSSTASAFTAPAFASNLLTFSRSHFRSYFYYLRRGFNLLFYGFGSKKSLLTEFARHWLSDGPILVVNGYNPQFHMKHLLNALIEKILQVDPVALQSSSSSSSTNSSTVPRTNPESQLNFIADYFAADRSHTIPYIYIIIHNLDSPALRSFSIQHFLSRLASLERIHVIASVDELGSSVILGNGEIWNRYSFLTVDATTYAPYPVELPTQFLEGGAAAVQEIVRGIEFTLSSLTPSHRKILQILAQQKLDCKPMEEEGLGFQEYLYRAENAFAVTGDAGFRSLLHELLDHQLITRKIVKGKEVYEVPFSKAIIRQKICPEGGDAGAGAGSGSADAAKKDEVPVVEKKRRGRK
jgi:hypothetical protein